MHGVQDFPTAVADARLMRLGLLRQTFGLPIGYGDHTSADLPIAGQIDLVALGLGVSVLEKHLTLDRSARLTDYQASLEPKEFGAYLARIRTAAAALKDRLPLALTPIDRRYRQFQKNTPSPPATCLREPGSPRPT
jgi:sialic acid synthase SpsE